MTTSSGLWQTKSTASPGTLSGVRAWRSLRLGHPLAIESSPSDESLPRAPWQGVPWSLLYVAFLWYIAVITTYHLPWADVAMVAALVALGARGGRIRVPASLGWMAAFILWAAIGYTRTQFPDPVWESLTLLVKIWLISLVAANALRTRAEIRFFSLFLLACFVLYPVRGALINYFVANYALMGRAVWNFIYSNPNDLAVLSLLQMSVALSVLVIEPKRSWAWKAALVSLVLLALVVLMTQSRGGIIALAIFVIVAWITQRMRLRMLFAVIAVGAIVVTVAPNAVWTRMSGLTKATNTDRLEEVDPEGSAKGRFEVWRVAAKIIRDQPVLGIGLGAYPNAHQVYARSEEFDPGTRKALDTHSTFLNLLAETGIVGFLLFGLLVMTTVVRAERVRRDSRAIIPRTARQLLYLELGLLSFFVAGVFGSFARLSFLYIHLILIWSLSEWCRLELLARQHVSGIEQRRALHATPLR